MSDRAVQKTASLLAGAGLALLTLTGLLGACDPAPAPGTGADMAAPDLAPAVPLGPDEIPLKVTQRCPGDPGCPDSGDSVLYVGVGKRDVTPAVEPFTDMNGDGIWNTGEPFTDKNGNGVFDAYWIAGYSNGRLAYGVNDPLWARAIAVRQNQTTVVVLAVDTVGLFRDELPEIKKRIDPRLDIDLLLMHATHDHEAADLTGGWGPDVFTNGVNEAYHQKFLDAAAAAVTDAVQGVKPARVTFGSIAVEDGPGHDTHHYLRDSRDPVIIDNTLHTLQFVDISSTPPQPIGTLVNWANHPEALGGSQHYISSDFVHYLRQEMEQKGSGMVVYVNGPVGGLLTPGGAAPLGKDGMPIKDPSVAKAEALGVAVARFALTAMADPGNKTLEGKDTKLRFRTAEFKAHVENQKYHLAAKLGIFRRTFCCYDESRPLSDENVPSVETAVSYLTLGPASIITNPGELTSELFLGGYDGSHAGGWDFFDPKQVNAPDLSQAPKPPYLVDLMDGERAHRMTFGLTHDFLGYILPRFSFVLSDKKPYIDEAAGDHYEETNSLGPRAEAEIVGTMRQLVLDGKPLPASQK